MNHGEWTADVARTLGKKWEPNGWEVLFDHGDRDLDPPDRLGEIVSWFGDRITKRRRLGYLDIAVVKRDHEDKAFVLIEIEESGARPKVLIGDLFATLLGDHVKFKDSIVNKDRTLHVGEWTSFIFFGDEQTHSEQIAFLGEQVGKIKPHLSSGNGSIGRVILVTYSDESDLKSKVIQQVESALSRVR